MLYIVLILVLAALGLLVTALITANSLWAWISIGLSVLAGVLLVVDFLRRRSKSRAGDVPEAAAAEDGGTESGEESTESADSTESTETAETGSGEPSASSAEPDQPAEKAETTRQTEVLPAADVSGEDADDDGEPAEEDTDAADLLIVSELDVQVVVVDEHPRYHLGSCRWLADRETIPIAVSEARDLGFTPCARCRPDAKLAADHRAERKSPAE